MNYQNDDGGHLFATQFYGSGDIDNMVAMNRQVNRSGGSWYAMEQEWANALEGKGSYESPQSVSVKIKVKYDDSNGVSKRPTTFKGFYIINGRKTQFVIKNSYGG